MFTKIEPRRTISKTAPVTLSIDKRQIYVAFNDDIAKRCGLLNRADVYLDETSKLILIAPAKNESEGYKVQNNKSKNGRHAVVSRNPGIKKTRIVDTTYDIGPSGLTVSYAS